MSRILGDVCFDMLISPRLASRSVALLTLRLLTPARAEIRSSPSMAKFCLVLAMMTGRIDRSTCEIWAHIDGDVSCVSDDLTSDVGKRWNEFVCLYCCIVSLLPRCKIELAGVRQKPFSVGRPIQLHPLNHAFFSLTAIVIVFMRWCYWGNVDT